jgi:hypothetical protein
VLSPTLLALVSSLCGWQKNTNKRTVNFPIRRQTGKPAVMVRRLLACCFARLACLSSALVLALLLRASSDRPKHNDCDPKRNITDVCLGFSVVTDCTITTFRKYTAFVFRWTSVFRTSSNQKQPKLTNSYTKVCINTLFVAVDLQRKSHKSYQISAVVLLIIAINTRSKEKCHMSVVLYSTKSHLNESCTFFQHTLQYITSGHWRICR